MFAYPKQAEFNRIVPKNKIYTHTRLTKRVKELFITQIDEILWRYKLSPETINLPASHGIQEIQVFELNLRTPELDESVLETIDRAIPYPILFHLLQGEEIRTVISYKRPSEADSSKWVIEATFWGDPLPVSAPRAPLPVSLDLAGLYEQILRTLIPVRSRSGESLRDQVQRYQSIQGKERTLQQLEASLSREKQFNRKVELNAALRSHSQELETLKHS
jgi:hypothetical protein